MNQYVVSADLEKILVGHLRQPTMMMWNRLEGRPRTVDFARALKAEVRDPLWLLTRQWQMGEFLGGDAGSPVTAKIAWSRDGLAAVRGASNGEKVYDPKVPLEAMVEARPVELERAGLIHNADLRLALGRTWQRMLEDKGHGNLVPDFRTNYRFIAPDPELEADFPVTTAATAWQFLSALAGRAIDGGKLVLHLAGAGHLASDGLGLSGTPKDEVDALGGQFLELARRRYFQPAPDFDSWLPGHLEYGFSLSAPGDEAAVLGAREYHGGRLDWYDFDALKAEEDDQPAAVTTIEPKGFFPAQAQFDGMPNTRHWTFEEGAVNFGDIKPDTQDLAKLLLVEFGLIFGNDWFLLPIELPVGSLTRIRGLAVTNVFGDRTWIEPAVERAGPVGSWQMFTLSDKGADERRLFLPPATAATLESEPVELVDLVRDEVSNMVWGIEQKVQLADGSSRRGRELADALHARHQAAVGTPATVPSVSDARIAYRIMTAVPENWIPFIPVHIENDNREIQLQRAAMPRLLEGHHGVVPAKIQPRTAFFRERLKLATGRQYFIAEEEVGRAGTVLETRWQRCRWTDGRVVLWLGNRRSIGRGEGSSGLAFDVLVPKSVTSG